MNLNLGQAGSIFTILMHKHFDMLAWIKTFISRRNKWYYINNNIKTDKVATKYQYQTDWQVTYGDLMQTTMLCNVFAWFEVLRPKPTLLRSFLAGQFPTHTVPRQASKAVNQY